MPKRITGEGPNPGGLCMCGCGGETNRARQSDTARGLVKGKPLMYISGHGRKAVLPGPNPSGLCMCGCGKPTSIYAYSHAARGRVAGAHAQYIPGHSSRWSGLPDPYVIDPDTGCWVWQRSRGTYGHIKNGGVETTAHRVYYERLVGPIPSGHEVHHLCGNKRCVNPSHLRAIEKTEHQRGHKTGTIAMLTDVREVREVPDD